LDKVIGLGDFGCAVAEQLTAYPEYRIYKINSLSEERGSLSLDLYSSIDQYENNLDEDEVAVYLRSVKPEDEVLFIVEGGDPISGATLKILKTISDAKITVLYISPDRQMISDVQKRDDRIVFGVLQEYARSGAIERIFLASKPTVEKLVGDVSIQDYEKSISYFVSYTLAMYNFFRHTKPVLSNAISPPDIARIVSLGVSSLEQGKQDINLLFPLADAKDIHFFHGIPKDDMVDDTSLIKKIKTHAKEYKKEGLSTSFSVYETTLENPMVLCIAYSSKIQGFAS
tara:strand:+ start:180 stop:1034 length:855 start_codon:yes stop_codon:yes gene_type:complete